MKQKNYLAPEFLEQAFHCPRCNVYAMQIWKNIPVGQPFIGKNYISELNITFCRHCKGFSFWINKKLLYPPKITAPLAHWNVPKTVLGNYNETLEISICSPRTAVALLRIDVKKLCETLGENESNLNRAIGKLSKKGSPQTVI